MKVNELSITHCRPRSIFKKTRTCVTYVCHPDRDFPPKHHMTRFFCAAATCACSMPIKFPSIMSTRLHQAIATNKQYSTIQSRMHLHDTVSAPVANRTLIHLSGTFFIVNISKACIPDQRGNQHALFYTGDPSLSLFPFTFFPFTIPSSITIWHHFHHIITEHGALLTGHGSWMALSVNVVPPSATPPNIPIPM